MTKLENCFQKRKYTLTYFLVLFWAALNFFIVFSMGDYYSTRPPLLFTCFLCDFVVSRANGLRLWSYEMMNTLRQRSFSENWPNFRKKLLKWISFFLPWSIERHLKYIANTSQYVLVHRNTLELIVVRFTFENNIKISGTLDQKESLSNGHRSDSISVIFPDIFNYWKYFWRTKIIVILCL